MRNRKVQREMRRTVGREEKLDLHDYCGIKDHTHYEAVKKMIIEDKKMRRIAKAHARAAMAARAAAK